MHTDNSPLDLSEYIPGALQAFWGVEIAIKERDFACTHTLSHLVTEIVEILDDDELVFARVKRSTVGNLLLLLRAFESLASMPSASPANQPDLLQAHREATGLLRWILQRRPRILEEMRDRRWFVAPHILS